MARFDFVTAGESHGPGLTAIVEGMPAGLELDREALDLDMARRQLGHGRGGRMKIEKDSAEVRSGVRHGRTLGSPIALLVANRDYENWVERMGPWESGEGVAQVHLPRPGHADLPGVQKFGFDDVRNVLERASARETAARVAAGGLARQFLAAVGVTIRSHVTMIAGVQAPAPADLSIADFDGVDDDPVRCLDPRRRRRWSPRSTAFARRTRASAGPSRSAPGASCPGIGSHVSWDEKLDGRIAQAMVSIQSVKGVSIGPAWEVAASVGSEAHDEIFHSPELGYNRETNRAGGIEGGMTNGETVIVQVAIKPISTLTKPLRSVDIHTKEPTAAHKERTDSTVVPAAGRRRRGDARARRSPGAYREKFGGDHIDDVRGAVAAYRERIGLQD